MEIKILDYDYFGKKYDLLIHNNKINGVMLLNQDDFIGALTLNTNKYKIIINDIKILKKEYNNYKKYISYVPYYIINKTYININSLINSYIIDNELKIKNPEKKIKDALRIVGLSKEILYKNHLELSSSEKKLLIIAMSLLSNPKLLILDEPFKALDKKNKRIISILIRRLKEQFKITIVIISDDSEIIYKYTDNVISFTNDKIIQMNSEECFTNYDLLKNNDLSIPESTEFTNMAIRIKKTKIEYHKDIRDIIKDIYKHI